jgi:Ca-activated chloride channel homolog
MNWTVEQPIYWLLLLLSPLLWAGWQMRWRVQQRIRQRLGRMLSDRGEAMKKGDRRRVLMLMAALFFLVVALAGPIAGTRQQTVSVRSRDIVLILDISLSMLARDVLPNRLARAKSSALAIVDQLGSEQLGLVLLAGNGYPYVPLTHDIAAVQSAIRSISPDLAPTQGTAIGHAVTKAARLFSDQRKSARVIILISDGETHDTDALAAVREAAKQGIMLFCVGVGTSRGSRIPIRIVDEEDVLRDESGVPVQSALEEAALKKLARLGGGDYFRLSANGDAGVAGLIRKSIASLTQGATISKNYEVYDRYFPYALTLALLFLSGSMILHRDKTST